MSVALAHKFLVEVTDQTLPPPRLLEYQQCHLPSQTFLQSKCFNHKLVTSPLPPQRIVTWEWACPAWLSHVSLSLPSKPLLAKYEPILYCEKKKRGGHTCRQLNTSGTGVTQLETNTVSSWQHSGTKRCHLSCTFQHSSTLVEIYY